MGSLDDAEYSAFCTSLLATIATLFSLLSNFWCGYVSQTVDLTVNFPMNETVTTNEIIYYGIWNWQDYSTWFSKEGNTIYYSTIAFCRPYGDLVSTDSKWKSAMAFSILAAVVGGIVSTCACFATCVSPGKATVWKLISLTMLFTTLFQGLTFLFFQGNGCQTFSGATMKGDMYQASSGCVRSTGANLSIAAVVFWFLATLGALAASVKGKASA